MTGYTNIDWFAMSDSAIVAKIGAFIKNNRLQQNITQAQLAESAGINRWTVSQIEKGEAISLHSLILILRALQLLHIFDAFVFKPQISPLEIAKQEQKKRKRARNKNNNQNLSEW